MTQDDLGLMLEAYPIERGIGDRYSPLNLLMCSEERWVLAVRDIEEPGRAFFITSDDAGRNWREMRLTEPFSSSFSDGTITVNEYCNSDKLLEISLSRPCVDTLHYSFKSAAQIVRGEDIIGVWNAGKADYFRIAGKTLTFASRIEYGSRLSDYIPEHIYQYGNLVYTSVLHPGLNQSERMFVSNDYGKSWAAVSTESEIDRQLDSVWTPEGDAWFMAGYKDRMVSYCVGYKDDLRRDFIKKVTVCQ